MTGAMTADEAVELAQFPPTPAGAVRPGWREAGVGAVRAASTGIFPAAAKRPSSRWTSAFAAEERGRQRRTVPMGGSQHPDAGVQRARDDRGGDRGCARADCRGIPPARRGRRRLDRRHAQAATSAAGRERAHRRSRPQPGQGSCRAGRRSPKQKRRSLPSSTPISSIAAADLADVITPLLEGRANVVFGTRAWTSRRRATSGT